MSKLHSFFVEFYFEKDLGNGFSHYIALYEVVIKAESLSKATEWAKSACYVIANEVHHPLNKENDGDDELTVDEVGFHVGSLSHVLSSWRKHGELMDPKVRRKSNSTSKE